MQDAPDTSPHQVIRNRERSTSGGRLKKAGLGLLCILFVLVAALGCWMFKISRDMARFHAHANELLADAESKEPTDGPNAAPLYRAAVKCFVPRPAEQDSPFSAEDDAAHVAANAELLRQLREAAQLPRCDFDLPLSGADQPGASEVENLEALAAPITILLAAMHHQTAQDRPDEVLSLFGDYLAVARHMACSGDLQMVQNGMESVLSLHMQPVLSTDVLDEPHLLRLLEVLDAHRSVRSRPEAALHRMTVRLVTGIDSINRGGPAADRLLENAPGLGKRLEFSYYKWAGNFLELGRQAESCLSASEASLRKPWPTPLDEVPALIATYRRGLNHDMMFGFDLTMASVRKTLLKEAEAEARMRLLQLAVYCRLYRLKLGQYPSSLSELGESLPADAGQLPADPFTGDDLSLERTDRGCLLWSFGPDRKDDSGTPSLMRAEPAGEEVLREMLRRGRGEADPTYDYVFELRNLDAPQPQDP